MEIRRHKILIIILLIGLVLRFSGLEWGHPFIFQPDEDTLVRGATGIRFDPNPHHFDWPTLQTYLLFFIISVWAKFTDILSFINIRPFIENIFPIWFDRPFVFYLLGRIISALAGSGSIVLSYLISKKIFNKKTALLAVFLLAISLQNIEDAHFATLDSTMTFWMLLSFYFSQKIYEKGFLRYYVLAGFVSGLAASTKYNGASIFIALISYHILFAIKEKGTSKSILLSKKLAISFLSAIFGFLIGTPYAILDFRTFIQTDSPKGALWQFSRQTGIGFFKRYANLALIEQTFRKYSFLSLGVYASLLSLWGLFSCAIFRYKKGLAGVLSFTCFYLWYVGQFPQFLSQYFNPLYPFLAMFAAYGFFEIFELLSPCRRKIFVGITVVFLSLSFWHALKLVFVFSTKDTRLQAREYIYENVPAGVWLAFAGADKIEIEEYNAKDNMGYNLKSLSFLIDAVGRHESERTVINALKNDYNIEYVVVGDYGLKDVLGHPYAPGYEDYSSAQWAVQNLEEVARFKPRFYNEPWVIVYKL
ncbi:MAG: glycosyltransferase family 39 protein [Patescibacteria group bacterium]